MPGILMTVVVLFGVIDVLVLVALIVVMVLGIRWILRWFGDRHPPEPRGFDVIQKRK